MLPPPGFCFCPWSAPVGEPWGRHMMGYDEVRAGRSRMRGQPCGAAEEVADILVPVPLHWTRLFARRFNQAALLTQALAKLLEAECGVAAMPRALVRRRKTVPHVRMSAPDRWRNVKGAFALHASAAGRIEGRRIILIDNVITN